MRFLSIVCLMAVSTAMVSFASKKKLTVTSSAFTHNGTIPSKYSCEGEEVSPPLTITGIPSGTMSLALIVHDPDAPMPGGFTHWVAWNLSVDGMIPENFQPSDQGLNGSKKTGYKGMCPPTGTHHYHFKVYALDSRLVLGSGTDKAALEQAMNGHILGEGDLVGLYAKKK